MEAACNNCSLKCVIVCVLLNILLFLLSLQGSLCCLYSTANKTGTKPNNL